MSLFGPDITVRLKESGSALELEAARRIEQLRAELEAVKPKQKAYIVKIVKPQGGLHDLFRVVAASDREARIAAMRSYDCGHFLIGPAEEVEA